MKPEQKVGIMSTLLGAGMGGLSTFLGGGALGFGAPIAAYAAFVFGVAKMENKKLKWGLTSSILTFLLVWILVWILSYNVVIGTK
jgi:hypothetical protein